MAAETPDRKRRRGPRPRHSREEVVAAAIAIGDEDGLDGVTFRAVAAKLGTGVMSLYNYVPDKQTLVYEMNEAVSAELDLPEPSGDWRADIKLVAHRQRDVALRHPWLPEAVSHTQPMGPATLAFLDWALGALEPTGMSAADRLETIAFVNGFVLQVVRSELAAQSAPAGQFARLPELLATGKYPRFAAAVASTGPPVTLDLAEHFDRLLDRILDGLIGPSR
jgi:AcrR family transcriptional regulator